MIQQVSLYAPNESAREGLIMGTVNTIVCIWGKDEGLRAFEALQRDQAAALARHNPQAKPSIADIGPDDASTWIALEASLRLGRN